MSNYVTSFIIYVRPDWCTYNAALLNKLNYKDKIWIENLTETET